MVSGLLSANMCEQGSPWLRPALFWRTKLHASWDQWLWVGGGFFYSTGVVSLSWEHISLTPSPRNPPL